VAQQNPGTIAIRKQVVDASGNVVADASGFRFGFGRLSMGTVLSPDFGPATTVAGSTSSTLTPGTFRLFEQARTGCTVRDVMIGGVLFSGPTLRVTEVESTVEFTVNAGQTVTIDVRNTCGAAAMGTVNITKNIVDANGNVVAGADRSGVIFGFGLVTGSTVRSPDDLPATTAAGTSSTTLAPGTWRLFEGLRAGCTPRTVRVGSVLFSGPTLQLTGGMSNVEFTISAGQTVAIEVNNTCSAAVGPTRSDRLVPGCNNLVLTFPAGTPLRTVAQGVSAGAGLISIFRLDSAARRFVGFSPTAPDLANDYTTVTARLETVFICVGAGGTLTQPEV
jgi:hypothetical protein